MSEPVVLQPNQPTVVVVDPGPGPVIIGPGGTPGVVGGVGVQGPKGDPGPPPEIVAEAETLTPLSSAAATATKLDEVTYQLRFGIPAGPQGPAGVDGKNVEIRANTTHLQWRWQGDAIWQNLTPLEDLRGPQGLQGPEGPQGLQGPQGDAGPQGPIGATPELTMGLTQTLDAGLQATATLVEVSPGVYELQLSIPRGPQGPQGEVGPQGPAGIGVPDPSAQLDGKTVVTQAGELVYTDLPTTSTMKVSYRGIVSG